MPPADEVGGAPRRLCDQEGPRRRSVWRAPDRARDDGPMMRISIDHRVMDGVPCVAGTRVPVTTVLGLLGQGCSIDDILADYPTLCREDVLAALRFAASAVDERELPLRLSA
jgi:uncharacterized protein (DUF433 family)